MSTRDVMQDLARGIDTVLGNEKDNPKVGFALLVFPIGGTGIGNYVGNVNRADTIKVLRESADRLEQRQDNVRKPHPEDAK